MILEYWYLRYWILVLTIRVAKRLFCLVSWFSTEKCPNHAFGEVKFFLLIYSHLKLNWVIDKPFFIPFRPNMLRLVENIWKHKCLKKHAPAKTHNHRYYPAFYDIFWRCLEGRGFNGEKIEIFWGNPPFGPLKDLKISKFFKSDPTWPPVTKCFLFRIN